MACHLKLRRPSTGSIAQLAWNGRSHPCRRAELAGKEAPELVPASDARCPDGYRLAAGLRPRSNFDAGHFVSIRDSRPPCAASPGYSGSAAIAPKKGKPTGSGEPVGVAWAQTRLRYSNSPQEP